MEKKYFFVFYNNNTETISSIMQGNIREISNFALFQIKSYSESTRTSDEYATAFFDKDEILCFYKKPEKGFNILIDNLHLSTSTLNKKRLLTKHEAVLNLFYHCRIIGKYS